MTYRLSLIALLSAMIISAAACGGGAGVNAPASNSAANTTNAGNTNGGSLATTTPTPAATQNNAPTLTPFFRAYCEAMEKKNEAGIRKAYSKDTLDEFEKAMKEEGSKNLVEYLSTDNVTTALCEIRNEVITGNEAVAELRTAAIPNGEKFIFVKEGEDWKLTNRSPALTSVKETAAPPANKAK